MYRKVFGIFIACLGIAVLSCTNPSTDTPPVAVDSANVNLATLTTSSGTISPAFEAGITAYTLNVANAVTSVTVTGTAADSKASVSAGLTLSDLEVGVAKTATITVTAEDGTTTKAYTVEVTRQAPPSSDATLSDLTVSSGSLSPTFAAGTLAYTVNVENSVTSVTVTGAKNDANATITPPITLSNLVVGVVNTATITVTAQDCMTAKAYTVTVTRQAAASPTDLASLTVSSGTLSPAFAPGITSYTLSVANAVTSVTVSGTVNSDAATVSGPAIKSSLAVGKVQTAIISVTVGAETKNYFVYVTRQAPLSNDAMLKALGLNCSTVTSFGFSSYTTSYNVTVANTITSVIVTGTANQANATVTGPVTLSDLEPGVAQAATITVTAQDGTTIRSYTVAITRNAPPSTNANLSTLTISSGVISPEVSADVTSYTASVPYLSYALVNVQATAADTNAKLSSSLISLNLEVGVPKTATFTVTAQDGTTKKVYTVAVTMQARKSSVRSLATMTVSGATLFQDSFDPNDWVYSGLAPNDSATVTVAATLTDPLSSLSFSPAQPSALSAGLNRISATVTAEDGTKSTYTIDIYKNGFTKPEDIASANIGTLKGVPAGALMVPDWDSAVHVISTGFRMGQYEITREQIKSILGTDPSIAKYSSAEANNPANSVTWYQAIAFCNKLSIKEGLDQVYSVTGVDFSTLTFSAIPVASDASWNAVTADWSKNGYRLPTRAEWLWAAMGASDGLNGYLKTFPGSTGANAVGDYAWFSTNSGGTTHQVGTKLPNELGIYDMGGNVYEWDWNMYALIPMVLGDVGIDFRGPSGSSDETFRRLLQGGSAIEYLAGACALDQGDWGYIPYEEPYHSFNNGFRVVRQ